MKKVLLFIAMFMFLVLNVSAESVSMSCPSQVYVNENFTCTLSGNFSSNTAAGINGTYSLNGVSFVSFSANGSWNNMSSNSSGFAIVNTNGSAGSFTFGSLVLKATSTGSKTISVSYEVSNSDFEIVPVGGNTRTINVINRPTSSGTTTKPSTSGTTSGVSSGSSSSSTSGTSTTKPSTSKPSSSTNKNNSSTSGSSANKNSASNNNASNNNADNSTTTPVESETTTSAPDLEAENKAEEPKETEKEEEKDNKTKTEKTANTCDDSLNACKKSLDNEKRKSLIFMVLNILLLTLLIISNFERINKLINKNNSKESLQDKTFSESENINKEESISETINEDDLNTSLFNQDTNQSEEIVLPVLNNDDSMNSK